MKVKSIFIHCSAREQGDVLSIDQSHRARMWSMIGYHYVVLNGSPDPYSGYIEFLDGQIHPGRPLDDDPYFEPKEIGAHVRGRNLDSIGVCLIGKKQFTDAQLYAAKRVCHALMGRFGLSVSDVLGHYEDPNTNKTCPNIPMDHFRNFLQGKLSLISLQELIQQHVLKLYGKSE